ncbi:MAG: sorbosone dehydrogenase family protein, partial [Candidatus Latescibacteria bacterium]|nr:sorbosone dehydrogenase family protein [bacterium]MBD3425361.1 sorbosone dehydrogenase family protein [Candidatus Latescibacterota bacterium]
VRAVTSGFIFHPDGYLAAFAPSGNGLPVEKIELPAGFRISIFADNVPGARSLALGDRGTIFVGTRSEGKVYALADTTGNGKADIRYDIAGGLDSPNGVALKEGALYIAEISRILRINSIEDNLAKPPEPEVVFDSYPEDRHHGWKFIAFGPDGLLYVPVGAPCNICPEEDPYSTITRLDLRKGEFEIFARGVRNTVGFDWHPDTGDLWFTENGRDWLGDNRPPDELNTAPGPGMHFGFPYCHGTDIEDPDIEGAGCGGFTPPEVELGPHVAALGMRFYRGEMFPERYRNSIFIAEHGSWNRTVPIGYRIVRIDMEGGRPQEPEVFADGWLQENRSWGRPVDLLFLSDGSMLISDDKGGAVYRITYSE